MSAKKDVNAQKGVNCAYIRTRIMHPVGKGRGHLCIYMCMHPALRGLNKN